MFTEKDIGTRSIFVINCIDKVKHLKVKTGELLVEEDTEKKSVTLTKFPFQKVLVLFVIGNMTVTTPLIEKCRRYNVALIVVKPNLRPVFYCSDTAEGNFLLRKRQYSFSTDDISVAKELVRNKIMNQLRCLAKTRKKDEKTVDALEHCKAALETLDDVSDYYVLMGFEGVVSKNFFSAYFQNIGWSGRRPRAKCDIVNVTLDIGYTILFNFLESFIRLFGFDVYIGVYHRLWYKRKSLVCDLVEPFRCIIDHAVLLGYNRGQFTEKDFKKIKEEYYLKPEKSMIYYKVFSNALIERKRDIFIYVRDYYRSFMRCSPGHAYPKFLI